MTGQKTHEAINLSIRIGSLFVVLFLITKLLPVRLEMPWTKWFRRVTKTDEKVIFETFSTSRSAVLAGFSEQETLSLLRNDFFQSYSQAISVLGSATRVNSQNPASYLAYLALFAAGQGAPGQRYAALKAFFRYYPDIIDDPSLLARVVSFLGGREVIIDEYQAGVALRHAIWGASTRAVERIRAAGSTDYSELSVLKAICPELEQLLAPAASVADDVEGEGREKAAKTAEGAEDAI